MDVERKVGTGGEVDLGMVVEGEVRVRAEVEAGARNIAEEARRDHAVFTAVHILLPLGLERRGERGQETRMAEIELHTDDRRRTTDDVEPNRYSVG